MNLTHDTDIMQNDLDALINFDDATANFFAAAADDGIGVDLNMSGLSSDAGRFSLDVDWMRTFDILSNDSSDGDGDNSLWGSNSCGKRNAGVYSTSIKMNEFASLSESTRGGEAGDETVATAMLTDAMGDSKRDIDSVPDYDVLTSSPDAEGISITGDLSIGMNLGLV
jgi:hypothetical protein